MSIAPNFKIPKKLLKSWKKKLITIENKALSMNREAMDILADEYIENITDDFDNIFVALSDALHSIDLTLKNYPKD